MNQRLKIADTPLPGLKVLRRKVMGDSRGYLERVFCAHELSAVMQGRNIVQINHTLTVRRGAVRGLHFQYPPYAEMKIVSCLRGTVFDVAVDLRRGSATYLRWHGEVLSADNHTSLLLPEGFGHGFQALTDDCELLYLHTAAFAPQSEGAVNVRDPRLGIGWPEGITELSGRDESHPMLSEDFGGLNV